MIEILLMCTRAGFRPRTMKRLQGGSAVCTLAALLEDLSPIPSTHTAAHPTICNSNPRGSNILIWPPGAAGTPVLYRRTCRQNA